ncbi:chemotaxis protein CheX [Terasakiella sp. SH-1]|uniref:chemotaxis protein CheX n=1 Tax=Terasakiella sp. SH-1 TaxID=2560057 RepID=UPI001073F1B4|nr:chemotaxis protein CheX [Terasakiella sp. SH-1]
MKLENMNSIHIKDQIRSLVSVIARYTENYLSSETGVEIKKRDYKVDDVKSLDLLPITSLVSVGGHINLFIAFSFDEPLLDHLMEAMTEDLEVDDDEHDLYIKETACEVVNTIVGNSTADLAEKGTIIPLSPPVVILGAKTVAGNADAKFFTVGLESRFGRLEIDLVGPTELFDDHLNFIGTGENNE